MNLGWYRRFTEWSDKRDVTFFLIGCGTVLVLTLWGF